MTGLSRRNFIKSLAAAPAIATPITAALGNVAGAQAAERSYVLPLAYINIGRFEVIALTDGYDYMPFAYFTGPDPSEIERAAETVFAAREQGVGLSFNQFLVRDGDQLILIDSGPAGRIGETGALPTSLAALGVAPEEIDAVIVTHLHADHVGGLVAGGRQNFPNAEVYVDVRDVDYWTDPAKRAGALLPASGGRKDADRGHGYAVSGPGPDRP